MKRAIKLAYAYVFSSILIGPALVFTASSRNQSGWDCSDPTWGGTPIAAREAFYEHAARFMTPIASLMIVIGLGVLIYLFYVASKNKHLRLVIVPVLLIFIMFIGYSLIISVASSSWCYSN
jgi:hypothetical protein